MQRLATLAFILTLAGPAAAQEYLNGIEWQEPPVVQPGATSSDAPSDAIVLFDGTNLDQWQGGDNWTIEDGAAVVGGGKLTTKQEFGDLQLHIEWSAPTEVKGEGQGRGNSGVFLMDRYEIQVLDSYQNKTYYDGQAGAIYKQTPPMANAMRKPGEWNTYDIIWTCPRFNDAGQLLSPAYITAVHNGVLILNHFELKGDTPFNRPPQYNAHPPQGPISLQDHGNPVRYRNIWVRELQPVVGQQVRKPFLREGNKETPIAEHLSLEGDWTLKTLAGQQPPASVDTPRLMLMADGKVAGFTGVNRLMGQRVATEGGGKLFGPLATTRRAGPPAAMQLEREYTQALGRVDAFEIDGSDLRLLAEGVVLLEFKAAGE